MHFYIYLLLLTILIILHLINSFKVSNIIFYYIHYLSQLFTDSPFYYAFSSFYKKIFKTSLSSQIFLVMKSSMESG